MNNIPILRKDFSKYATLNMLGMVGFSFYILVDTFFIAKAVGTLGLAALNFAIPAFSLMQGMGLMLGIGSATIFSVNKGALSSEGMKKDTIFSHSCFAAIILAFIFLICGMFFANELSLLLGASPEALPLTYIYIRFLFLFSPFFLLNNILLAFTRNDGNPKLPMIALLSSSIFNVIMDYILMFPLNMGMLGAILATCFAPIVSILILSAHIIRKKNTFHLLRCKIEIRKIFTALKLGVSSFVAELSTGAIITTFNILILAASGNQGVAAYGIITNVAIVFTAIFTGLAQGAQPLSSKLYGERNSFLLHKVLKYSVMTAFFVTILLYSITLGFLDPIINIFNTEKDPLLAEIARDGSIIYFIGYFFASINIITAAYLSSVLKAKRAMIVSLLRSLILIIPMAIILANLLGLTGIWLTFTLTEFVVMIISIIFLIQAVKEDSKSFKK